MTASVLRPTVWKATEPPTPAFSLMASAPATETAVVLSFACTTRLAPRSVPEASFAWLVPTVMVDWPPTRAIVVLLMPV